MTKKEVVITGMGCVSPYGVGVETLWDNVKNGNSGIRELKSVDITKHLVHIGGEVPLFYTEDYVDPKEAKRLDKFTLFAIIAADEAIKDAELDMSKEDPYKVGVIMGTAAGGLETISKNHEVMLERGFYKCSPFTVPMMIANIPSGKISMRIGSRGLSKAISTACATGAHSIGDAMRSIQAGDADIVIAGGTESGVCDFGLGVFTSARTLSRRNEEPKKASRPYDVNRDGFVLAEGAAALIMEEKEHAIKRGAKIYAQIVGYGQSSDAYDLVAPDPEGRGAEYAVKAALKDAGITPEEVDYINMHGTSTHLGDIAESKMVANVFGDRNKNQKLAVSSTKSSTGHMMGSAGAIEAIISIKSINEGIVAPTINLENQDPEVANLNYTPFVAQKHEINYALSNSFGFGGCNAVLLFKKFNS
jgi:3-oxoacyl-[acyl-carrier-protein] synthase II